ncbi:kinase-like domain-containing protein [Mycena alexandri]|uniref:Kinase-like domain-containing protein n=1 Tax=Mycena alexandri TaxID=1745969 RepID=A0AAD6WWP2_9AGAR|nr:kinase-like domain-containing protein [Mycena alexandri]
MDKSSPPGAEKSPLHRSEKAWVNFQPFLSSRGYELRARYHPDWIPSWTVHRSFYHEYEDSLAVYQDQVLDATRTEDGKKVVLKRIETDGDEMAIIKYLVTPSARADPRNRTIPIFEIIQMPHTPWSFLVMPYCRVFNYPPFHCRNEFVDAVSQFMEGLQFMHELNIAHFDIAPQNMVMDESRVVPNGSHFSKPRTHTGFHGLFAWNNRCTVLPVNYYFIDFGLSLYFPNGRDTALHCETLRTFPDIPELSDKVSYNPFMVDIFQLGLTVHKLIDAYPALEAFRPVATDMTATNPHERPTPANSLAHLREITAKIPATTLSDQIWEKDTGLWKKVTRAVLGGYRYDYLPIPTN